MRLGLLDRSGGCSTASTALHWQPLREPPWPPLTALVTLDVAATVTA